MATTDHPVHSNGSGRRKHSFGGCRTCRRRHVKCDKVRPSCLVCRAVNVVCEGYASEVRWMPPATLSSTAEDQLDQSQDGRSTTRHHLYSEVSRASMSTALVKDLGSNSVDDTLAEIEERSKDPQTFDTNEFTVGSFGVFSIATRTHDQTDQNTAHNFDLYHPAPAVVMPDATPPDSAGPTDDNIVPFREATYAPELIDWFDPVLGFNDSLHWADLFGLDFDGRSSLVVPDAPLIPLDFSSSTFPRNEPSLSLHTNSRSQSQRPGSAREASSYVSIPSTVERISEQNQSRLNIVLTEVKSVAEAQHLLKTFNDSIIPLISFMPSNTKSPWALMQLPEAMRTLSEITYLYTGQLKHANAANLYGLLACSSYYLATNSVTDSIESQEYWQTLFEKLKETAKAHMKISLRDELSGPRKAKYKDQLMAILSLLAFTSMSGNHRDARAYMVDAERLLRVKGLAKRHISRKCRLLHHIYTWVRIVGESTYVMHDYQGYGHVVDNMSAAHKAGKLHGHRNEEPRIEPTRDDHNTRLDDFLRLEPHVSDSDLDIDEVKEHAGGLVDIHLEDSRQYHETMYTIYGVSETWLSLVSQVTRLANILDASKFGESTDISFHDFLQRRAGRLENIICSFALTDPSGDDDHDTNELSSECPSNQHMLCAMNSALVILFYRRIRNVNPLILQGHVDSVVQSLRKFDAAIATQGNQGPGSAWPAFIAGCEALSRGSRDFLMDWLSKGFNKCGLEYFGASRRLMKEVWEQRDGLSTYLDPGSGSTNQSRPQKSGSHYRTWVDVSREKQVWVILF